MQFRLDKVFQRWPRTDPPCLAHIRDFRGSNSYTATKLDFDLDEAAVTRKCP